MTKSLELAKECGIEEHIRKSAPGWGYYTFSEVNLETFYVRAQAQALREAAEAIYKGMPPNRAREMLRRMAAELESK